MNHIYLPHSDELEKIVLAICLMYPKKIEIPAKTISSEDFFSENNRIIFTSILFLWHTRSPVDLVILSHYLDSKSLLDSISVSYLSSLLNGIPKSEVKHLEYYCFRIKKLSLLRDVIKQCYKTISDIRNPEEHPVSLILELRRRVNKFLEYKTEKVKMSREGQNESTESVKAINS